MKIGAITLASACVIFELLAITQFLKARTTVNPLKPDKASELVTGGIYRISRNPMYVSLAGLLISLAIWLGQPLGLPFIAVFIVSMNKWQISPEEKVLSAKFGARYDEYCRSVPRWLTMRSLIAWRGP